MPPKVPSKYDIIPIHASDIGNYMRCRRYWDWSSPARNNLRQKVSFYGIDTRLWFGTGIHYALEHYYNPTLQRDPVETWLTWYELQWAGGIVTEADLEYTYDLNPKLQRGNDGAEDIIDPVQGKVYSVRGLRDLLPDDRSEEFNDLKELGVGMMSFYKDYCKRNDDFTIVAAETQFSIPLGFDAVDKREISPNYGKTLQVHARGKRDFIYFNYTTGRYGLFDHKTAANIGEDYFKKLDRDPQITTYLWASQKEALLHDLPWYNIEDATLQALRKAVPQPPSINANGWQPSINRSEESTTAQIFADYIEQAGIVKWYEENEKAQSYYNWLLSEGDKLFIQREVTRRNRYEIAAQDRKIKMIAQEMIGDPNIYANQTQDWLCLNCRFRGPCLAADDGSDAQFMLTEGYEKNKDR